MHNLDNISINDFDQIYFLGIGGIGMSALAKYFISENKQVAGYDKTPSPITENLIQLGADIHYEDLGEKVEKLTFKSKTLIIRTPAVPVQFGELMFFETNGYTIFKRSEVLGVLTRNYKGLGVAGTHGKTTTSCLLAHILNQSELHCNAFLGGISSNFNTNYLGHPEAEYTVIEADEFDRSFLKLTPFASIVTAMDADHLDIYGTLENFQQGFHDYAELIHENGVLIAHYGLPLHPKVQTITYDIENEKADYSLSNLRFENEVFLFDVNGPEVNWKNVKLGIPGIHNAENALACIALCLWLNLDEFTIRKGLSTFKGVKRRFEYHINRPDFVYIDDYAHHPTEIKALMDSLELLYPKKRKIGIFQPHLYTRTRDFFAGFSEELSRLDEIILLPIYAAREEPIEGITSAELLQSINNEKKSLAEKNEILSKVKKMHDCILVTIGAGDIDRLIEPIKQLKQS